MSNEADNTDEQPIPREEADQASQEDELDALIQKAGQCGTPKPVTQRVPYMLRSRTDFKKYYEPRAIAVGPIHHGIGEFQPAEKLKLRLAALFILECRGKKKEDLHGKIHQEIGKLKECYEEKAINKFSDKELAWLLFVDGCAMLRFIHYSVEGKLEKLNIRNSLAAFWRLDLFLLENQLAYLALDLLMTSSGRRDQLRESIHKFIQKAITEAGFSDQVEPTKPASGQGAQPEGEHLLDLLRKRFIGQSQGGNSASCTSIKIEACCSRGSLGHDWPTFRNACELQARGIELKPSKTHFLTDISFTPSFGWKGILTLPQITVDDSTATKFMNLVALEMCPSFPSEYEVNSFIYFLDSLIDRPKDVKALRHARILNNLLGSDKEVANLFNLLGGDLVPNPSAYAEVKGKIQGHYDSTWATWLAEVWDTHFRTPWTVVAFIAAIVGLALTGIQTYYAIHPSN